MFEYKSNIYDIKEACYLHNHIQIRAFHHRGVADTLCIGWVHGFIVYFLSFQYACILTHYTVYLATLENHLFTATVNKESVFLVPFSYNFNFFPQVFKSVIFKIVINIFFCYSTFIKFKSARVVNQFTLTGIITLSQSWVKLTSGILHWCFGTAVIKMTDINPNPFGIVLASSRKKTTFWKRPQWPRNAVISSKSVIISEESSLSPRIFFFLSDDAQLCPLN